MILQVLPQKNNKHGTKNHWQFVYRCLIPLQGVFSGCSAVRFRGCKLHDANFKNRVYTNIAMRKCSSFYRKDIFIHGSFFQKFTGAFYFSLMKLHFYFTRYMKKRSEFPSRLTKTLPLQFWKCLSKFRSQLTALRRSDHLLNSSPSLLEENYFSQSKKNTRANA